MFFCRILVFSLSVATVSACTPSSNQASELAASPTDNTNSSTDDAEWTVGTLANHELVALAEVLGTPAKFADKTVRIEGTVSRVCKARGCWIGVRDGEQEIVTKSLDHSISFATKSVGKKVVVEGIVRVRVPPHEHPEGEPEHAEGQHHGHAEGEHNHGEGEKAHSCPSPETLVEVTGARFLAGS